MTPELVAHDLHPEYLSAKFARDLDLPTLAVQHHHAHVAACMVEHRRRDPVVALAFDGLGYGPDGTLWGGELLVAGFEGFERVGHLRPVPMPGGAAAIREPWRMAAVWHAAGDRRRGSPCRTVPAARVADVLGLAGQGRRWSRRAWGACSTRSRCCSAAGRRSRYEAQAAIELECAARASVPRRRARRTPGS